MSELKAFDGFNNELYVGDYVEVYKLIGCKDKKGVGKVTGIHSIPSSREPLVFIKGFSGLWHPRAVKKLYATEIGECYEAK